MTAAPVSHEAVYRRAIRRQTRSSRSALAISVAGALALVLAFAAAEIVLSVLGLGPLVVSPDEAVAAIAGVAGANAALVVTAGIVTALGGLALLVAAVRPARIGRHHLSTDRVAVVVDDEVIGSALARRAAYASDTSPDNVRVSVSRRRAIADIVPTTGIPVDREVALEAVRAELDAARFVPALGADIRIDEKGRLTS